MFKGEKIQKRGAGLEVFEAFFKREKANFPNFEEITPTFYSDIRCGILHQAETTEAWRIRRDGKLLDIGGRCINSKEFVKALEKSLANYINCLREETLESEIWQKALFKLESIWNCKAS